MSSRPEKITAKAAEQDGRRHIVTRLLNMRGKIEIEDAWKEMRAIDRRT